MLIGKPGAARTAISAASSDRITVRGRDLAHDLMGSVSFTDYVFLLATGREPTEEQRFFLDLSLVALAEHGLTPSVQATRMTYDADPAALQAAIAAGVLGCGTVILGAADLCRISCVFEVVGAFGWGEGVEEGADGSPGLVDCPGVGLAQQSLHFGEGLFDWIEVWRVGGEEEELGFGGSDGGANGAALMAC